MIFNLFRVVALLVFVISFISPAPLRADAAKAAQYQQYGTYYYKKGEYGKALQYYDASYKLNPNPRLGAFIQKLRASTGGARAVQPTAQSAAAASVQAGPEKWGGWRIGLDIGGAYAMMALQDLKDTVEHEKVEIADDPNITGTVSAGTSGIGFGGRVLVFSPFGLGLGLGYASESVSGIKESTVFDDGVNTGSRSNTLGFSQTNIPISLIYRHPLSSKFSLDGELGIDMISATLIFDGTSEFTSGVVKQTRIDTGDFAASTMGYHIGMRGSYAFTRNIEVFLGLQYLIASLTGFEGNLTDSTITVTSGSSSESTNTEAKKVIMHEHSKQGTRHINFIDPGDPLDPADETAFKLASTGLRLQLGVTVLFP